MNEVKEMNKKLFWLMTIVLLSLLVACGSGEEDESTATPAPAATEAQVIEEVTVAEIEQAVDPVIIRFAVFDFEQGLYGELINSFEEENPDIEIKLVSIEEVLEMDSLTAEPPEDASRRLVSAADVSSQFHSSEAVADGFLLDLTPFMEADRNFDPADFQPQTLEAFQSAGGTWALPTDANYQLIFFNKDTFDEAGVDYPEAGWSWEDFLATAQALTIRDGDEVTQWGFVEYSPGPLVHLESRLGPLFNLDTDPPTALLDDPAVAEMLRWYVDLYLTHEVSPYFPQPDEDSTGLNIPEGYTIVESGQAAMWPEISGNWSYRSQQMNIGAVPMPVDAADSASSRLYPGGLSVSAGSSNPDAAWRWIDFLSRQASELGLVFGGGPSQLPARRSAAEAADFWNEADPELAGALEFAVDHAFTLHYPPEGGGTVSEAFEAIVEGEKLVEDALVDAQLAAEQAIMEGGAAEVDGELAEEIVVQESEAESKASDEAVTINFVAVTGALEMQAFRDLADAFLEQNPDIIVEIQQPNVLDGTPSITDISETADCFQWVPDNFTSAENQAAVLSLDPFLDADSSIDKDDFYPIVMDTFEAQGLTWGLPGTIIISLIEYNKDLFDEAGVDYPGADWTIDEFLDIAVAMTEGDGDNKQYGYMSELFEPSDMLTMIDRLGADLVDSSADPPQLAFLAPETIEAVRWYTSLTTEHGVKPILLTDLLGAAVTAVQEQQAILDQGRVAMWVNSTFDVDFGSEEGNGQRTGAVPLPAGLGENQGSGFSSATGYFISAGTEARQACWEWIKFMTEQPGLGSGLPARQEVAESDAYREKMGPELADGYLASIAGATQAPWSQEVSNDNGWLSYPFFWLYGAYDKIVHGEMEIEEALENVQQMADDYRACVIAADAFDDDAAQKACMLEIDETLPAIIFGG